MSSFIYYLALFFIGAIIGRIGEKVAYPLIKKNLITSGMLKGPYLPVYGFATLIITLILNKIDNIFLFFILCIITVSILEYFAHYILELAFNKKWWDFSNYKFNLHGRISLLYCFIYGVYALVFRFTYPLISETLNTLQSDLLNFIVGICFGILIVDIITSTIRLRKTR